MFFFFFFFFTANKLTLKKKSSIFQLQLAQCHLTTLLHFTSLGQTDKSCNIPFFLSNKHTSYPAGIQTSLIIVLTETMDWNSHIFCLKMFSFALNCFFGFIFYQAAHSWSIYTSLKALCLENYLLSTKLNWIWEDLGLDCALTLWGSYLFQWRENFTLCLPVEVSHLWNHILFADFV